MGFGPGCHSNCSGSSQTLGNPPVTLADLSPPQPEDNRSGGSGGPGRLSAQPLCPLPAPPPAACLAQSSWPQVQRASSLAPETSPGPPPHFPRAATHFSQPWLCPHWRAQRIFVETPGKALHTRNVFIQVKSD